MKIQTYLHTHTHTRQAYIQFNSNENGLHIITLYVLILITRFYLTIRNKTECR